MAKILTGPLAAGLSGKLGPVVFRQTRFGQVAQSKAKGRVHTTAPAMATKRAFGTATRAAPLIGESLSRLMDVHFAASGKTCQAQMTRNLAAAIRGEIALPGWPNVDLNGYGDTPSLGTPYTAAGRLHVPYSGPVNAFLFGFMVQMDSTNALVRTTGLIDLFFTSELVTNLQPRTYPAVVMAWCWDLAIAPSGAQTLSWLTTPTAITIPTEP